MKFDFTNTQYAKFWESRDAANALNIFVNDIDIIKQRHTFWRRQFDIDPVLTQRQPDGTAVYNTIIKERSLNYMLDMRSPLAEPDTRDKSGFEAYQGVIPDFAAKGYVETAMEREAKARMLEEYFGNDAQIVSQYADDIQKLVDEGNQTLSNLAAQALSYGYCKANFGTGAKAPLYKNPLPSENFVTAGTLVWSDASCKLIDQMSKIEQDYRDRTGSNLALKWQVTLDTFKNVILKNAQVIEYVNMWRKVNDKPYNEISSTNKWGITPDMFVEAFNNNPFISPIEVVDESQRDNGNIIHGWKSNTAVLRPVGAAGLLKRAGILDQMMFKKYGSNAINKVFAQVDGVFTLVNTTLNNGQFKEWHTDLFVAAIPVLDEIYDHIIVDINTADS